MGDRFVKKGIVVGIIVLFIGMSCIPLAGSLSNENHVLTDNKMFYIKARSGGNTLYVGGDGPGNYTKIQDAIYDAVDGDTVFVFNGTYHEAIDVDKSINLIGEDRDITKIINECEDYYAVDISADFVNISGFTIITNCGFERYNIGLISIGSCNNNVSNNILKGDYCGIELSGSSNNNTIIGNIIWNNDWGIYLSSSSNNIIKNNKLWNNLDDIILEENCLNNIITGNTLLNTKWCYSIEIYFSSNNTIVDNTFSNIWGCGCIMLYSSNKNVVMNNTMISVPSGNGISIRYSKENIIIGNTIKDLELVSGIYLLSATDNTITSNNLICCNTGISSYKKYASNDNTIHHNNFLNNTQNAYDECSNEWDNGYPSGGIYWDDYKGEDNDGDGIGDTPYNISGGDNQDRYPLMEPWGDNLVPIADFTWTPSHQDPEESIFFDASQSIDFDGNIILYEWDWDNDGIFDENYNNPTVMHTFEDVGFYPVTLRVVDNDYLTDSKTKTVRVGNQPPDKPMINGSSSCKPRIDYDYTFVTTDPEEDDVWYHISWGDKEIIYIYGPYPSGEEITLSYNWSEKGTYLITCGARDIYDAESNTTTFEVTIPRDKSTNNILLLRILERFPLLERLLLMLQV